MLFIYLFIYLFIVLGYVFFSHVIFDLNSMIYLGQVRHLLSAYLKIEKPGED